MIFYVGDNHNKKGIICLYNNYTNDLKEWNFNRCKYTNPLMLTTEWIKIFKKLTLNIFYMNIQLESVEQLGIFFFQKN